MLNCPNCGSVPINTLSQQECGDCRGIKEMDKIVPIKSFFDVEDDEQVEPTSLDEQDDKQVESDLDNDKEANQLATVYLDEKGDVVYQPENIVACDWLTDNSITYTATYAIDHKESLKDASVSTIVDAFKDKGGFVQSLALMPKMIALLKEIKEYLKEEKKYLEQVDVTTVDEDDLLNKITEILEAIDGTKNKE